jgi:hypothetical protein
MRALKKLYMRAISLCTSFSFMCAERVPSQLCSNKQDMESLTPHPRLTTHHKTGHEIHLAFFHTVCGLIGTIWS